MEHARLRTRSHRFKHVLAHMYVIRPPRQYDKQYCVKKPRASIPDVFNPFHLEFEGLGCQATLVVVYNVIVALIGGISIV